MKKPATPSKQSSLIASQTPETLLQGHLEERARVAAALVGEVHGPHSELNAALDGNILSPGIPVSLTPPPEFNSWDDYNQRHVEMGTGQEILKDEPPSKLYGVGILFPAEKLAIRPSDSAASDPSDEEAAGEAALGINGRNPDVIATDDASERKLAKKLAKLSLRIGSMKEGDIPDDTEADALTLARTRRPQSMGITFACNLLPSAVFKVSVSGGRYRPIKNIKVKKAADAEHTAERSWWVRVPVAASFEFSANEVINGATKKISLTPSVIADLSPLDLRMEIICREITPAHAKGLPQGFRLITATLVNRTTAHVRELDKEALFQARFSVETCEENGASLLLPLPAGKTTEDEEEQSLALLYRCTMVFSSGHGCTGSWEAEEGAQTAQRVIAEPVPYYETPPVTPDLIDPDTKQPLSIAMAPLAMGSTDWLQPLDRLHALYSQWISDIKTKAAALPIEMQPAAFRHVKAAQACADRIAAGLNLLRHNPDVAKAFKLTNQAILLQQIAGASETRRINFDPKARRITWSTPPSFPAMDHVKAKDRAWRPFQIAFLLMSIPGLWDEKNADRDVADLIWFPTGGGKTEAYLGASAFAMIARRLNDPDDSGTGVLMRYTLRLLTSQQFQRASGLICALEILRRQPANDLGKKPFSIGIWVGGSTTPNSRRRSLEALERANYDGPDEYAHVMLRCPWCASSMGPRELGANERSAGRRYTCEGLRKTGAGENATVLIHCPDRSCPFGEALPVLVVDDEIYESPPSLVIGTVDKFAMLAWKPTARALFGISMDGGRFSSPPSLVIQDELHLISGPLGSMVGLYEGVIEELCTDRRGPVPVRPKLVASTATTRASTRQIRELYAREMTAVFPPPGLDAGDSFFAQYDRFPDGQPNAGKIKPGRMYLGVLARAYGSGLTVSVRVFSALLAAARRTESDPWWTLLVFYNSLREIGMGLTLFGADIPERLKGIKDRWHPSDKRRYLREEGVMELTGRLSNSEVPRALERLERKRGAAGAIDACLASNIIEVGVDVPRLGLMAVAGQPKNTAQYIQATGRVGRNMPGLVVMLYDNRKPRDLSHYEQFRAYHARLYASVEPASVTPFTLPVLERALHGALISWMRQRLPKDEIVMPRGIELSDSGLYREFLSFAKAMRDRVRLLYMQDPEASKYTEALLLRVLKKREKDWKDARPAVWQGAEDDEESGDLPLMRYFGKPCRPEWTELVWPTPTSMRGVDAECRAAVFTGIVEGAKPHSTPEATSGSSDLDAIFGK